MATKLTPSKRKRIAGAGGLAGNLGDEPGRSGRKMRADVVRFVETALAAQLRPAEIVAQLERSHNLSARQGHRYIGYVRASMAADHEGDRGYYKHYARASLRTILRRALERNQLAAAVASVDRLARLDGLYEEVRVGVSHSGVVEQRHTGLSREQRAERLHELISLYASDASPRGVPEAIDGLPLISFDGGTPN